MGVSIRVGGGWEWEWRNGTVELVLAYAKPCRARHLISDFIKTIDYD